MTAELTIADLKLAAASYARQVSGASIPELYGATDGKTVGTYLEQRFRHYLEGRFVFLAGNSASGIDLPGLDVDLKVTSRTQPQSSCPFKSAAQKVYGLGYHLLVFVYDKTDDVVAQASRLDIAHVIFVERSRTADWQTTAGIHAILDRQGNKDDVIAYLEERNLPLDEIGREQLADRILRERPPLGYLTISNALQWRLQYRRVIDLAGSADGVERLDG